MTDRVRAAPSPARFGLTGARAEDELRVAGWWDDDGPTSAGEVVLPALARSADPDLALRELDRLREALGQDWAELAEALRTDQALRGRLFGVFGASSALADFVVANPDQWRRLAGTNPRDPGGYAEVLLAAVGADPESPPPGTPRGARARLHGQEAVRALRAAYRGLLLEIAADDLAYLVVPDLPAASYEDVTGRLSDLADASLRAALAVASADVLPSAEPAAGTAEPAGRAADVFPHAAGNTSAGEPAGTVAAPARCSLAVIAMGKCGGRELNYVSDVDVVFVGEGDLTLANRLSGAMMAIAGEACFQVDAALRPEGKAGVLVRTVDGHAAYYRRWARTWEFQALLKARFAAGDVDLARRYLDVVQPLVWMAADREGFVTDVQAMRRRVENHVRGDLVDRELKLGRGGLRDVEFAVQLLQLVHGRSDETLRSASTTEALAALGRGGYVGRADASGLGHSYRFLRTLEHRLQLQRLRRTHLFPEEHDTGALRWLARAAGIHSDGRRNAEDVLLAEFRRHVGRIRRLHEKLFYRPLLQAVARVPTEALRLTTREAAARLAALGYASPDGALRHIQALTSGLSRRAAIQGALLPVLLDLLAETPDPDGGLLAYRRVSEELADTPWYLRLLRDEGAVAERLALLLGTSRYVPDLLVRAPEVLRLLADTPALTGRDPAEVATSLRAAVARHDGLDAAVAAARSLRRHELLRVACADLLGLLDVGAVCEALSSVWVAVLQAALDAVLRATPPGDGGRRPARLAVIGMGRLGGAELGYGSDADVLFVCEPHGGHSDDEAVRYAASVAGTLQRLLGSPSQDPPLHVDANLRPEGRGGPLVRTLDSYRAYYAQWGEAWEAQALLRARFVAGDAELGERFVAAVEPVRYPEGGLSPELVREIRRIKARVDSERLPRGADPTTHIKLGRGGLGDIEWTAQLLQLRHGHEISGLRTTSTLGALAAAAEAGLLGEADAESLRAAWTLATRTRNAATLVRGKPTDQMPTSGRELAAVARALGHPGDADPGECLDGYRRVTRRARAVVERVFYDA
ncbi:bifunctional [glutamine synthetase] adenylyltransferase/[glutamine synthetase]-adenylyl-L-tyrosine phosphorylase [Gandjariella thermophila]|uniref:Bifunctional glutamine synthetase adenylyltransferase/adenylyl-removing enzyme n=1 Tax=Gandjariella thermophila TaxID=1931992 RepID=A0A4D4JH48_9PSEU|nr:bifunctional [glutamine synthetase] adenylyltransferase/[glutamine synthetase]-adenylyl-L-tyrosine phosphorylase [Gandjariella thermophila]GDY33619.1 glutamate-ammonia-ligase adenylyltransferase [Gandjariella thermophila]